MSAELTQRLAAAESAAKEISQKAAAYVETVQPLLDKHAAARSRFVNRASEVAGVLADRGIIKPAESRRLVEKFASDPASALDLLVKLARMIGPDPVGKRAAIRAPEGRALDAFEALALNGDPANTHADAGSTFEVDERWG